MEEEEEEARSYMEKGGWVGEKKEEGGWNGRLLWVGRWVGGWTDLQHHTRKSPIKPPGPATIKMKKELLEVGLVFPLLYLLLLLFPPVFGWVGG